MACYQSHFNTHYISQNSSPAAMVQTTTPSTSTSKVVRSSLLRKNLVYVKELEAYSVFETTFVVGRVYSEAQIIQEQVLSFLFIVISLKADPTLTTRSRAGQDLLS